MGPITLWSDGSAIVRLSWDQVAGPAPDPILDQAAKELAEYAAGERQIFDVPLSLPASDFANRFARALCAIPFGETLTYSDLARDLGVSAQAIGQACGANRIPILIPCHRVLGASSLGGFSGGVGVDTKVWLLKHEGAAGLLI